MQKEKSVKFKMPRKLAVGLSAASLAAVSGFGAMHMNPKPTVVTVSPSNMQSWVFYNDENDTVDAALGSFVTGPGTPLRGKGSAQVSVTGTQRRNLATFQFSGTKLADITTLKFATYNPSAGNGSDPTRSAYLNFNVDFNGSDTWQRRLVFVPRSNGSVQQNTWQEWDAIQSGNAKWTYSGATWPVTGQPGTTAKTWSQILTDYPGVRIRVTDAHVALRVGEPYADGYTENIDSFTFGTKKKTTVFDFEPDKKKENCKDKKDLWQNLIWYIKNHKDPNDCIKEFIENNPNAPKGIDGKDGAPGKVLD